MRRSLRSWLWRVPIELEVEEELALHAEMRRREGRPLDPAEMDQVRRACLAIARQRDRQMRLTQWLGEVQADVRFALRQLRQAPGFAAVAVLTLALGIGANSAIFALVDATLLRSLPYANADRLVVVEERSSNHRGALASRIAPLNVRDWEAGSRSFEVMAAVYVSPGGGGPALTGTDGTPEIVPNQTVTARFFDVFGVQPLLGRAFREEDEIAGTSMAVIGELLWRSRFSADPSIVGRAFLFDGRPTTILGVMPANFQFLRTAGMWTLYPRPREDRGRRVFAGLRVVARLKPGSRADAAQSELTVLADRLARAHGDERIGRLVTVLPMRAFLVGDELRRTSMLFLGVVACVLLLCCANVANLLLTRASARSREMAVRSAVGAGRRRIVRQLLTESLVLAAFGGVFGAAFGAAILAAAPNAIPPGLLPGAVTLEFDARLVAFCGIASLVVGLLFGLAPAWQSAHVSQAQALASEGRSSTGRGGRVRQLLVVAQAAAAVLLLCGAGLLLRTVLVLDGFSSGVGAASESVLTMDVTQTRGANGLQRHSPESQLAFYAAVEREVGGVPGIRGAAWATTLPLGNAQVGRQRFQIVGDRPLAEAERPAANYQLVSPSYFATVELPIVDGRAFTDFDSPRSEPVCIVSEAFVQRFLGGRSPIGQRVAVARFGNAAAGRESESTTDSIPERLIVGVARQVKGRADETEDQAQIYVPIAQDVWRESYLLVRTGGPADSHAGAIRAAIARVDPHLPVRTVQTLEAVAREATARYRFRALLVVMFAALALVLALGGLFGVLAYAVQQRQREFGLRLALGAAPAHVLHLVMREAGVVVAIGIAIGLAGAAVAGQSLSAFLFGVRPHDPLTFAGVAAVMALTAAVAAGVPAWGATRVDPATAFREE
jgi:putative ABC transport system permease protein